MQCATTEQAGLAKEILNSALSGADLTRRLLAVRASPDLAAAADRSERVPAEPHRHPAPAARRDDRASRRRWRTICGRPGQIPSQVGDALLNLAINARDAMPHGGSLSIATANVHLEQGELDGEVTAGDYVVLSVTDTGTGMAPEVLERVVEPFFTTKGPGAGSGLGLSMIFGFARQSGGHLRIDSELGHGTTVRLYLPRADGERIVRGRRSHATHPCRRAASRSCWSMTTRRCARWRGVIWSRSATGSARPRSGPAALEILQAGDIFDLLFTDVVMPDGMTGYQLAAAARQLRPGLKVLFTTGYSGSDLAIEPGRAPRPAP